MTNSSETKGRNTQWSETSAEEEATDAVLEEHLAPAEGSSAMNEADPSPMKTEQKGPPPRKQLPLDARLNEGHMRAPTSVGWAILIASCLATGAVHANDSTAAFAAGGVQLTKTDDIAMASEVLEISSSRVRVDYVFQSHADHDVDVTVAVPMPRYGFDSCGFRQAEAVQGLRVEVDGKALTPQREVRAFLGDVDVTARLRGFGLNDDQIISFGGADCDGNFPLLSSETVRALTLVGLIDERLSGDRLGAMYTVATTYSWPQRFLARQAVRVRHDYQPLTGEMLGLPDGAAYCFDSSVRKWVTKQDPSGKEAIGCQTVHYVLSTGSNWRGPIEDFRLRLVKKFPGDLISLCFPGNAKRLDSRTLEFAQPRFEPKDDLQVMFCEARR